MFRQSDFYDQKNAAIFKAMMKLAKERAPIDLLTVRQTLHDSGELESSGGNAHIISLTNGIFTSSHAEKYAKIIKEKAMHRAIIQAGNDICLSGFDESTDVDVLLRRASDSISRVPTGLSDTSVTMDKFYDEYVERLAKLQRGERLGYRTGMKILDGNCDGLQPGTVTRLVAYSNTGKTRLAISLMCKLLQQGIRCAFFSTEVVSAQFFPILASSYFEKNFSDIKFGRVDIDWDVMNLLPLHFYQDKRTVSEIIACARFHQAQVVFIDYVQNIKAVENGTKMEHLDEYAQRIQQFAIDHNVAVFDLSQMNNEGAKMEGKGVLIPTKGSGDLVQTADVAIVLTRKVFDKKRTLLEFDIRKNKYGPLVSCELAVDFSNSQFVETPSLS